MNFITIAFEREGRITNVKILNKKYIIRVDIQDGKIIFIQNIGTISFLLNNSSINIKHIIENFEDINYILVKNCDEI